MRGEFQRHSFKFPLFQATLTILDKLDIETENPTEEEVAQRFGWEDAYHRDALSLWQRTKPKMYSLFDEPHSSSCARVRIKNTDTREIPFITFGEMPFFA